MVRKNTYYDLNFTMSLLFYTYDSNNCSLENMFIHLLKINIFSLSLLLFNDPFSPLLCFFLAEVGMQCILSFGV